MPRFLIFCLLGLPLRATAQEYPIHVTPEGYIIVQVSLADGVTGNFILDTGAGANVLSAKLFQRVSDQAEPAGYFTGFRHDGDRLDGPVYTLPYLAVGDVRQERPVVGVYPPLDDYGIDGLLSLKFFENKPFTIDYSGQKLIFQDAGIARQLAKDHPTLPISVYRHTDVLLDIFLPIRLNDKVEMLAEFDTGSGHNTYLINDNYIKELGIDGTALQVRPYRTQLSGEERQDYLHTLHSLALPTGPNGPKKEHIDIIFREKMIFNALIGSGFFRDGKITIDVPNQVFIIHD